MKGIYQISNKINNKKYIGSSKSIEERWSLHKRKLNNNTHFNSHLQRSYNKNGKGAFGFKVHHIVNRKTWAHI